jgi:hypothetical protein
MVVKKLSIVNNFLILIIFYNTPPPILVIISLDIVLHIHLFIVL